MNLHQCAWCLCLGTFWFISTGITVQAQESSIDTPALSSSTTDGTDPETASATALELEKARDLAERDRLLRLRLNNTVWNDLDLPAGAPGQVWMLRPARELQGRVDRAWVMNSTRKLPRVGSWEIKDDEILFKAMNGTLVGRAKYDDDQELLDGYFIASDRQTYGRFRLREETKRNYRSLTMKHPPGPRRW